MHTALIIIGTAVLTILAAVVGAYVWLVIREARKMGQM